MLVVGKKGVARSFQVWSALVAFEWLDRKLKFDRMTDSNLHVKFKPAAKVFSINEVLPVLYKILSRKALDLLATLIY